MTFTLDKFVEWINTAWDTSLYKHPNFELNLSKRWNTIALNTEERLPTRDISIRMFLAHEYRGAIGHLQDLMEFNVDKSSGYPFPRYSQDFEDAAPAGWSYTRAARDGTQKMKGSYSVKCTSNGGDAEAYFFSTTWVAAVKYMKVNIRPDVTNGHVYAFLQDGAGGNYFGFYFKNDAKIYFTDNLGSDTEMQAYAADTWYKCEMKDIDWTTRKVDCYIDDVKIGTYSFSITAADIAMLQVLDTVACAAWYDDFALVNDYIEPATIDAFVLGMGKHNKKYRWQIDVRVQV